MKKQFKTRLYEALYSLNRGFEDTLSSLDRLEHLNAFKVALEHTRAEANEELVQTLQDYEQDESARFEGMKREWEEQREDPDDVFFAARDRKLEIREQIKELRKGLERQRPRRRSKKKHR